MKIWKGAVNCDVHAVHTALQAAAKAIETQHVPANELDATKRVCIAWRITQAPMREIFQAEAL